MVRIKGRRADAFFFFAISWILFRTEEYVSGSLFFGLGMMDRSVCETHLQEQFDPKLHKSALRRDDGATAQGLSYCFSVRNSYQCRVL